MGMLSVIKWRVLDANGDPLNGAKAYFYQTGTSTPKNTYSDKTLSSANANPVVADADGWFGRIFLLEDEAYRVVLKDSSDVTQWTEDNVFASSPAVDELTRRKAIARSPMDHGAVGDGSTNDATALAAALTALASGGVLDLEGKTYRCDSTLSLVSAIMIRNGTIDFSNAAISAGLQGSGTAEVGPRTVSSATAGGQSITPDSVTDLTAGDLVRLRSSDTLASTHKFAELFRIEQISGSDVLVDGVILGTYTTSPFLEEVTPVSDLRFEDLTLVSPSGGYAIDLSLCQRVNMRNVSVRSAASGEGVRILSCYGVKMDGCSMFNTSTAESSGIIVGDASRDVLVTGCHIERALTAIEIGDDYGSNDGISRDVRVTGCDLAWCGQINIAAGAWHVDIENNTLLCDIAPSAASTPGILIGGADVTVRGNHIRNPDGAGIKITPLLNCDGVTIVGNRIRNGETHGIHITDTAFTVQTLSIVGNEIHEVTGSYINMDGTLVTSLLIDGNRCRAGTGSGPAFDLTCTDTIEDVFVHGNHIDCGSTYSHGIHRDSSGQRLSAIDNVIRITAESTQVGIDFGGSPSSITISGNAIGAIYGTDGGGCNVGIDVETALHSTIISNNRISNHGTTPGDGINIAKRAGAGGDSIVVLGNAIYQAAIGIDFDGDGATAIVISGNVVANATIGVQISATTQACSMLTINGNHISGEGGSGNYTLDVNSTGGVGFNYVTISGNVLYARGNTEINTIIRDVDAITVDGNIIRGGTYGIDIDAGSTEAIHDSNVFTGQATGTVNGTFDTTGDSI